MKNSNVIVATVGIAFVIAIGAMAGSTANAAIVPTVGLGTAANFSVLAYSKIENLAGQTTIDRDVGLHPGALTAITGFPPGIIAGTTHAADAVALQGKADLGSAYTDAAGRPPTSPPLGALGGLTLVGGVYPLSSLPTDLTGPLTLDGASNPNSVWIFQAPSTLITATGSSVNLINGASPCNVFWQVGSSATLETGSTFRGTILALTSITVKTGTLVEGRTLASNAAVQLDTNRIITSTCNAAPAAVAPPTLPPCPPGLTPPLIGCIGTPAPAATATPGATVAVTTTPTSATATPSSATATLSSATATPTVASVATATPTIAPTAHTTAPTPVPATAIAIAGTQNLPSTSTGDPLGPLAMLGIALTSIGILLLARKPVRHP